MSTVDFVKIAFVVLFTVVAAVCDFRTKKLPNWLTVPGFVAAVVFQCVQGALAEGWRGAGAGLLTAMAGFGVGFGILFVLWLIGGGGAGDVKLMGALGAWFGPMQTLVLFFVSTVFVVVLSAGVLGWQMIQKGAWNVRRRYLSSEDSRNPKARGLTREEAAIQRKLKRRLMPYGVPVAFAAWVVLVWSFRSQLFGL